MINKKIAEILRNTTRSECIEAALRMKKNVTQLETLNFRNLDLKLTDIITISNTLKLEKEACANSIKSISFSYNKLMGDDGAIVLARSLPSSITELGLVNCGIGDNGGYEILNWIRKSPNIRMICMEENHFSDDLKMKFKDFKRNNLNVTVVI